MSILSAINQSRGQSRSLDELARLPQSLIMQMVQNKEIPQEQLAPILSRKAEIADTIAKAKALESGAAEPQPTVVDQLMAKNAQEEHPVQQPMQMAQQMPMAPEQAGVGQLPIPERAYAGGGIIAFGDGGDVEPEDDEDKLEMAMAKHAASSLEGLMAGIRNIPKDLSELVSRFPKSYENAKAETSKYIAEKIGGAGGHKYEDAVIAEAKRQGVDPKLALHVLYKETGNLKNPESAVSKAGAIGPMQLMPKTAKSLGVDPTNPMENIHGGVKYLAQLGPMFNNNPRLVAAAYNAGPGNVRKHGGVPNFKETQNYVQGLASGGYIPGYSGSDGVSYIDLYGNKVDIPMGNTDEEAVTPAPKKSEPEYKQPARKTAEEILNSKKPAGPQNPFNNKSSSPSVGVKNLLPRRGGDEYSNVYPVGGAGADASYLNQLLIQSQKDPSYQPYKDEIATLLKKNPNLESIVAQQNKATNQPVIAAPGSNKPLTVSTAPNKASQADVRASEQRILAKPPAPDEVKEPSAKQTAEQSYFDKMIAQNAEERENIKKSAAEDKNLALLAAGLGMMGGTSPYAFANIGQGGLQGVQALAASKTRRASELAALNKAEATGAYYGELSKDRQERAAMNKANQLRDDYRTRLKDLSDMAYNSLIKGNPKLAGLPQEQILPMLQKEVERLKATDPYYLSLAKQMNLPTSGGYSEPVLNYNPKTRSLG
jgi:hypothetical protein